MKKHVLLSLFLSMGFLLTACPGQVSDTNKAAEPLETESVSASPIEQEGTPNAPSEETQMWESETVQEEGEYPVQTQWPVGTHITPPETAPELKNPQQEQEKTAEGEENTEQLELPAELETTLPESGPQEETLVLSINGTVLDVQWEENETVAELLAYVHDENIMVNTTIYGGFEQVGSLPQSFSRNDTQMTTGPGDIALYSGNQLVLFFGSNSWSYTKLGHINGMSVEELSELLGADSAIVEIKPK